MKCFLNVPVAMSIAVSCISALLSSCVNPDYELSADNLDLDVTLFQDGIAFPLGKTAAFTLGELYDKYGQALEDILNNNKPNSDVLIEFDDNFPVGIALTADDVPETLINLLASGTVGLGGRVINGLPLQFELEFQFLDTDGNVVSLAEGIRYQVIKPCAADGTPQTTELTLVQNVKTAVKDQVIAAVRLIFKASAYLSGAAQFSEDSSLETELTALVPKGLSLNLEDLWQLGDELTDKEAIR